jgi:lipoprotein-anchoring transpeptidase ErfK/SrfK
MKLTRRGMLKTTFGGGAASAVLGACAAPIPPAPMVDPVSYAARRDGRFTIPAVPMVQVPEWLHRQVVRFTMHDETPGTIYIQNENRLLYLILEDGWALRYGIGVGRIGLGWTGEATVYRTAHWPGWTPTPSMIRRDPSLAEWADGQPGGPANPLGARALYLATNGVDQGYRIHGTPAWRSIGRFDTSGCFRMINQDVIDLYGRVGRGTRVVVV